MFVTEINWNKNTTEIELKIEVTTTWTKKKPAIAFTQPKCPVLQEFVVVVLVFFFCLSNIFCVHIFFSIVTIDNVFQSGVRLIIKSNIYLFLECFINRNSRLNKTWTNQIQFNWCINQWWIIYGWKIEIVRLQLKKSRSVSLHDQQANNP